MNPAWATVLVALMGALLSSVGTFFVVKWRVGSIERRLDKLEPELVELRVKVAAYTGDSNGHD